MLVKESNLQLGEFASRMPIDLNDLQLNKCINICPYINDKQFNYIYFSICYSNGRVGLSDK